MAQDAVATLEATREKLIKKLREKKRHIEEQLKGLERQEMPPISRPSPGPQVAYFPIICNES
jgi:hypothetical protein